MPFERKRMIKYIEKTPITQGWSDDYKYFALGADGKKYLLRVTPGKINPDFITLFEAQKKCASIISAAENIPMQQVPMSIPIECGKLDDIHAFCDDIRQHTEGTYDKTSFFQSQNNICIFHFPSIRDIAYINGFALTSLHFNKLLLFSVLIYTLLCDSICKKSTYLLFILL